MELRPIRYAAAACVLALWLAAPLPAGATTLRDALAQTYNGNPTLTGARAQLRAADENVAIARSQGRLQASATGSISESRYRYGAFDAHGASATAGVDATYPFYSGGRVKATTRAANARVDAGRAGLRATEGDVFTDAVGAYMDVIRDTAIVDLNRNQVKVLETNLEASRDRFEVGDLTRTDVAQSQARLDLARSQLAAAEGQLTVSNENYLRVIGSPPLDLQPPPPLPDLPAAPDDAAEIALDNNPDLATSAANARAAAFDVDTARAARLPTFGPFASGSYTNALGSSAGVAGSTPYNTQLTASVGLQLRVPLYQGGLVGAQVRQARDLESQAIEQQIATERQVIAQTRSAFASYRAAQQTIAANDSAVSANQLALEGARAENSVGTRTVLDVLNAEQELLNSQVTLVTARRDLYVAGFALLNAMGRAEARYLGLDGGPLYDPVVHYKHVAHDAWDWDDGPKPVAEATRTVGMTIAPAATDNVAPQPTPKVQAVIPSTVPPGGPQSAPTPSPARADRAKDAVPAAVPSGTTESPAGALVPQGQPLDTPPPAVHDTTPPAGSPPGTPAQSPVTPPPQ